ncbi:hypothetical protein acdb102_29140 [Acidothermaceae bacterium B102]|nr:hypothetical protein acdb102_29140 [Acidothermaceae bacterium B102]
MTDAEPSQPVNAAPAPVQLAGDTTSGAKTLFWGALIMVVAVILIVAGSSSSSDGSSDTLQSAGELGWVMAALAAPFVLIGCIAVGVRMGLRDRDRDRD